MQTLYEIGPYAIAAIAAIVIAAYTWNKLRIASIITLVWGAAAIVLGQFSYYVGLPEWQDSDWLGFLVFGTLAFTPAGLLIIAAWRVPRFKKLLDSTPTSAFVITQVYRIGGVFLIMAYLRDELPVQIGLFTGVLDVFVATTAVLLAIYLRGGSARRGSGSSQLQPTRAPWLVMAWASLAILDFAWATALITLSHWGLIDLNPAPVMMGNPPLVVISFFALPFGIFVSVYLIARMRREIKSHAS